MTRSHLVYIRPYKKKKEVSAAVVVVVVVVVGARMAKEEIMRKNQPGLLAANGMNACKRNKPNIWQLHGLNFYGRKDGQKFGRRYSQMEGRTQGWNDILSKGRADNNR